MLGRGLSCIWLLAPATRTPYGPFSNMAHMCTRQVVTATLHSTWQP